jgi:tetrathionate reductase subunit B
VLKIPEQIARLGLVTIVLVGGVLVTRFVLIPPALVASDVQRASAIEGEIARPINFAGATACRDCHEEVAVQKAKSYHRNLSCEGCHGPSAKHAEDPLSAKPTAPRDRKFCPLCHTYDSARPTGFPQINPVAHNPLKSCVTCHNAHRAHQGRVEPRAAELRDLPHRAAPAPDGAPHRAADEAADPGVLRQVPRHQGHGEGGAEDRAAHARPAVPLLAVPLPTPAGGAGMNKREFLKGLILFIPAGGALAALARDGAAREAGPGTAAAAPASGGGNGPYDARRHHYGMGIEIDKCIGCSRCVEACKTENDVPREPFFFRTWIERYSITRDEEAVVESINVPTKRRARLEEDDREVLRSFFVPKLCNHCANPPCVQVCPVSATFTTEDGAVLVDGNRCIGCRYCIQACPYGARYLHPTSRTADKCTFCYHRVVRGLLPACVEACPTQARIFGDLKSKASRLVRFRRMNKIHVLKPDLNTEPKVYYAQLDGAVR